jgi:hypothetical protein
MLSKNISVTLKEFLEDTDYKTDKPDVQEDINDIFISEEEKERRNSKNFMNSGNELITLLSKFNKLENVSSFNIKSKNWNMNYIVGKLDSNFGYSVLEGEVITNCHDQAKKIFPEITKIPNNMVKLNIENKFGNIILNEHTYYFSSLYNFILEVPRNDNGKKVLSKEIYQEFLKRGYDELYLKVNSNNEYEFINSPIIELDKSSFLDYMNNKDKVTISDRAGIVDNNKYVFNVYPDKVSFEITGYVADTFFIKSINTVNRIILDNYKDMSDIKISYKKEKPLLRMWNKLTS